MAIQAAEQINRPLAPGKYHEEHWWKLLCDIRAALIEQYKFTLKSTDVETLIDEYAYTNGLQLTVPAQTQNPVVITSIIVYSQNSGATLMIEDRPIPVPQGLSQLTSINMFRREGRSATLTATAAGNLFVELMGTDKPRMSL